VTGLVNVQGAVWLYVALPAGAICMGLFLISLMLEKETGFDQEQHALLAAAESAAATDSSAPSKAWCTSKRAREEPLASVTAS